MSLAARKRTQAKISITQLPFPACALRAADDAVFFKRIVKGLARTLSHFLKNLTNMKGLPTIQYPEMLRKYSGRFRGRHILK